MLSFTDGALRYHGKPNTVQIRKEVVFTFLGALKITNIQSDYLVKKAGDRKRNEGLLWNIFVIVQCKGSSSMTNHQIISKNERFALTSAGKLEY